MNQLKIILIILLFNFSNCKNKVENENVSIKAEIESESEFVEEIDSQIEINDSSNQRKFYHFSLDTLINFYEIYYRVETEYDDFSLNFRIYKDNILLIEKSIEKYGPYAISFEDFNNDSLPDFRVDNKDLKNIITHLFQWNSISKSFEYLDSFHDVKFFKPNYFVSINILGIFKEEVQIYKIENSKAILIKNFEIDYSGVTEGSDMLLVIDRKDSIRKESEKDIYKLIDEYKEKIKNVP